MPLQASQFTVASDSIIRPLTTVPGVYNIQFTIENTNDIAGRAEYSIDVDGEPRTVDGVVTVPANTTEQVSVSFEVVDDDRGGFFDVSLTETSLFGVDNGSFTTDVVDFDRDALTFSFTDELPEGVGCEQVPVAARFPDVLEFTPGSVTPDQVSPSGQPTASATVTNPLPDPVSINWRGVRAPNEIKSLTEAVTEFETVEIPAEGSVDISFTDDRPYIPKGQPAGDYVLGFEFRGGQVV